MLYFLVEFIVVVFGIESCYVWFKDGIFDFVCMYLIYCDCSDDELFLMVEVGIVVGLIVFECVGVDVVDVDLLLCVVLNMECVYFVMVVEI